MIPFFSPGIIFATVLTLVVMGLLVFTLYMLSGGGNKLKVKRRDETSRQFLQEKKPALLSWKGVEALSDLSSLCVRRGESSGLGGGWSHCRGTVQSLTNHGKAWLAYTVNTHRRLGTVEVHTSTNKLLVNVTGDRLKRGMRYAEITVDGQALGGMRIETRELFNDLRIPIGKMRGGRTIIMRGMTNYVGVEIHNREIAQINTEPYSWFERLGPMPPAFRLRMLQLTPDEEWWLVGLLAVALYRDCLFSSV